MGQQISLSDFEIPDLFATNNQQPNDALSTNETEDVHLFLPFNVINEMNKNFISLPNQNSSNELSITEETLINQIRNDISVFSNLSGVQEFNTKMSEIIKKMFDYIAKTNTSLQNSMQSLANKQKQLQKSYVEKLKDDENEMTSIFSEASIDSEIVSNEQHIKELSFFAVQSFITMLLMLLQFVHKSDFTIVHQMLNITNQLVEQIPLNSFSSKVYKQSNDLFKSLKPLTNYIKDLSSQTDINPIAANQSIKILLNFSVIKASFKDILPLIRKLIFNTNDIFDIRKLFIKLNKDLTMMIDRFEKEKQPIEEQLPTKIPKFLTTVKYLELIEVYPTTKLIRLNENKFTGQFICSVLLVYIDLHNKVHGKSKFEHDSINGSFSFALEPKTFQYLYEIIEQLTIVEISSVDYILNVCLRLFTTHLQVLIDTNLDNFHDFLNENDINKWFTLISKLAFESKSEEIKKEASQALIYLIGEPTLSFGKMLTFIHKHIIENQYPILIDQFLNKLTQQVFIYKWIESLCNNQHTQDRTLSYTVLHSFIDIVLNSTSVDKDKVNRLHEIIIMFQELLFLYLDNQSNDISDDLELSTLSILAIEYATHVIQICFQQEIQSNLFEPLLLGLSTLTDFKYNFTIIQPIFAVLMPLFAKYILQTALDVKNKTYHLISWLLGKMCYRLILGPSESPLEKKYTKTLKSPLLSGGFETLTTDINAYLSNLFKSDLCISSRFTLPFRRQQSILNNELLISIYHNRNEGATLISKMKLFVRNKHFVQKEIEEIVNQACAAVFAVYIKHYRRIDLAQYELMQPIEQKPHAKLLVLYEYANEIRRIFSTTHGGGNDCDKLCEKIKNNALLLLVSIRESSFISKIKEDYLSPSPSIIRKQVQFQRQKSHWTKAKSIIQILRNTLNVCVRLKHLMLEKKRTNENKQDSESIMHRAISNFLPGNEKFLVDSNEIVQCLTRQYQRAMTRLITYRFIEQFLISSKDKNRYSNILFLNLNNEKNFNWHYLENIQASNNQLKEDIGRIYYKIIQNILSFSTDVKILRVLNLINLNYDSIDLCFLNEFQLIQELFHLTENIDFKFVSFNWFRLVVLKLCENLKLEKLRNINIGNRKFHHILEQQCNLIFNQFILNQLKQLQDEDLSSKNSSLCSFVRSSKFDIERYLILLLRCVHSYEHIRLYYATSDYIEQLFHLYHTSQCLTTRLLTLKILRDLLIYVPDGISRSLIENFLTKSLFSIGQNFNLLETEKIELDIIIEFIYIYRQILSFNSPWQKFATELLIDGVKLGMNIELTLEFQQINVFLGSVCILGGYVRPYCLGSTVEIYSINTDIDELQFGIIIEIDRDSSNVKPYLVQYAATNQTEWVSSNQIRIIVDVQTPNVLLLPIDNAVHTILDTLGFLVENIDTSKIDSSLILLNIKCRVVKALYEVLNYKQVIEIFMEKSYASILAKLSISMDYFSTIPNDLRLFNRLHLEQYYLSLDRYTRKNPIVENKLDVTIHDQNGWNQKKIIHDPVILQYLSETSSTDDQWKPIASKNEIKSYQEGRLGTNDIEIISVPVNDDISIFEECGIKHKFKGRININDDIGTIRYRTFIPNGIELNKGKWYFCVRFPLGGAARIGWATKGFNPPLNDSYGIGDDQYSWSVDGQIAIYNGRPRRILYSDPSWDENDVCGCGIEIDGENTNIKYWQNDKFLGTIYSHSENKTIKSLVKTDLLPNGAFPTYFPAVTVKVYRNVANTGVLEFIFSPEDMTKCPLPNGYKPLLMPKLLPMENVLVPYPYSAYLIGKNIQQYFYTRRSPTNDSNNKKTSLLRDFVNDQHFEVPFNADMITMDDGLLLSLDNHRELTISLDFEISTTENHPDELDVVLFKIDDAIFSVHICMNDNLIDETNIYRQHVAILFQINEQTKVYINNHFQTLNYYHSLESKLNLRLLPCRNVGIRNLGIWRYLLSEEHIQRLFTYGLSYVAIDYHKLKEYQQRFNVIQFKAEQKYFINETLVPFTEPFKQNLWEETKQSINDDESMYFKTLPDTNQSVVQLFGNKTYLVLNTANQIWSQYTLILDISIPNFPSPDDKARLTLLSLDSESEIYMTHDGHLHITGEYQSLSTVKFQEYIRLLISVQENSIDIYVNGSLELDVSITENQFATKLKRIDLFRESDLTKNPTNDDQLRIECRSITYLNKSTDKLCSSMKNLIQSTDHVLDQLVFPSFDILSTSLIGIGYKEESIKYVMKKYNTTNSYFIDKILREENQILENISKQEQQQKRLDVLQRLNSYDENGTLHLLVDDENIPNNLSISNSEIDKDDDIPSDKKWFYDTVRSVGIDDKLEDWIQDQEVNNQITVGDPGSKLLDLAKADSNETESTKKLKKTMATSSHYKHQDIPSKTYIHLRRTCEYGLLTIYARHTILHMFKVWYNDDHLNLFPLTKFGDEQFIVQLFMHHHTDIDRMNLLIKSILIVELKDWLKCPVNEKLNRKAPVFFQLQKQVVQESISLLTEPSLMDINNNNNEQIFPKQSKFDFIFKTFDLFLEIFKDFEGKTDDINSVIQLLFPGIIIKILFDLFLWIPLHQSKMFILALLTKLIQTSEHFKLHNDIQNFLHHLFLEVIPKQPYFGSKALLFFRRSLIQFELTLMERENQFISSMNEWPGFMKDVAITFDLINSLTNRINSYQWYELVFTEAKEILGEKVTLTKEMVETAHTYFDGTVDLQVMKFMNQNIKLDGDSSSHEFIIDFIENLPAESIPDQTRYGSYTGLCNLPSVCVQTRIKLLYLFNVFLRRTLVNIDFNVTTGIGFIVDRIRSVRYYILFTIKFRVFNELLTTTAVRLDSSEVKIKFDIIKASIAEHSEDTMFYQAYKQLKSDASRIFRRKKDEQVWNAIYVGMHSIDQGGPYRDSVTRICADLCSTRLSLFILCPNGQTNTELNRDRWIPNVYPPNRSIPNEIRNQYRFVGQLMGMAIRTKEYLNVRFPILLWKQLIHEEVTIDDIEAIDSSSFTVINEMKKNIQKIKSHQQDDHNNYLFDSVMTDCRFDIVSSSGKTYELVPGGSDIQITAANFEDYCMHYRQYRIKEFYRQIEYIRQGLYSVVPWGCLTLFTAHELEETVCGKGCIDIKMLKRHTRYEDDDESSPHIQQFWSILSDMFSVEQKKLFLIFVWGRTTLPYTDDEFSTRFTIARLETSADVDKLLPKSFTCAFTLQLPPYSTKEIMYERLNYAITYCSGIDADGHMN